MNRWHIYELLKNNSVPTKEDIAEIERMNASEVKEGVLEWLTLLSRDKNYQKRNSKPNKIDEVIHLVIRKHIKNVGKNSKMQRVRY
jgi:hypothetical protein